MEHYKREVVTLEYLQAQTMSGVFPNVVTLHNVIENRPHHTAALILDYANQGPLVQDFQDAAFSPSIALQGLGLRQMAKQFAVALLSLHEAGVAHRDIKPHNVLLTIAKQQSHAEEVKSSSAVVVLIDFGSSHVFDVHDASTARVFDSAGALYAFCPESISEMTNTYDARQLDIWQYGVLLYLIAFGKVPFSVEHGIPSLSKGRSPIWAT